jgi:hypothetical protein
LDVEVRAFFAEGAVLSLLLLLLSLLPLLLRVLGKEWGRLTDAGLDTDSLKLEPGIIEHAFLSELRLFLGTAERESDSASGHDFLFLPTISLSELF